MIELWTVVRDILVRWGIRGWTPVVTAHVYGIARGEYAIYANTAVGVRRISREHRTLGVLRSHGVSYGYRIIAWSHLGFPTRGDWRDALELEILHATGHSPRPLTLYSRIYYDGLMKALSTGAQNIDRAPAGYAHLDVLQTRASDDTQPTTL